MCFRRLNPGVVGLVLRPFPIVQVVSKLVGYKYICKVSKNCGWTPCWNCENHSPPRICSNLTFSNLTWLWKIAISNRYLYTRVHAFHSKLLNYQKVTSENRPLWMKIWKPRSTSWTPCVDLAQFCFGTWVPWVTGKLVSSIGFEWGIEWKNAFCLWGDFTGWSHGEWMIWDDPNLGITSPGYVNTGG